MQPLSPESKIGSSALNLHFINCTDCHLLGVDVCVIVCVCGDGVSVEGESNTRGKDRRKEQGKERKEIKHCLSPKLCVINVKLLPLSPPLLPVPLSQTASTFDRSS